ncbi:MAG: hypothetical protein IKM15_07665 [Peptococcaceae bacterium]|nr:hypothetical protein [Peptococcaceae bacterium]
MDIEKQKEEAISRLSAFWQAYHINPNIKRYFKEDGDVYYSYVIDSDIPEAGLTGLLDRALSRKRVAEVIERFQAETGALVYHCIEYKPNIICLLYVGKNEEEWEAERLKKSGLNAYVYNFAAAEGEEGKIRNIHISSYQGVIVRVA